MKIEEAIVYVMVKRNGGMTTDQIADAINRHRLHLRKDGQHRPCRMNAMTGTFATQFLSKPDGVVHGRLHGTAV